MNDDDRRFASIARALALVEKGLRDDLDVAALAEAACYSIFHFVRVFTELTGHGPYDYLVRRRVAEAAREAVSGRRPLLDLALDYRFDSPEGFARAFRRCFGMAPSEARRLGSYPARSARTPIDESYARRLRAAGLRAASSARPAVVVVGAPIPASGPYPAGAELVVVPAPRDEANGNPPGGTAFAGRILPEGEAGPGFPALLTRLPGGKAVTASAPPPLDLELARDYLYRTALPLAGASPRGDAELVYLDGSGSALSLCVPLS